MKFLLFIGLQRKWIMMATVSVIVIAVFISILVTYQTKIIIDMIET